MSKLWMNIRLLTWHLQAGEPDWYSFKIKYNKCHKGSPTLFEIYDLEFGVLGYMIDLSGAKIKLKRNRS